MSFEIKINNGILLVTVPDNLSEQVAAEAVSKIPDLLKANPNVSSVVIEIQNGISYSAFRHLSKCGMGLRKEKRQMYLLTPATEIHRMIKSEAIDKIIRPISSLNEIPGVKENGPAKAGPPKLDVSFINPFVEGTMHVLKVQAQMTSTPEKPLLKGPATSSLKIDIASLIGITSANFNGGVAICFPDNVYLAIMSNMFGETYTEITKDIEDGAGEILNMIFGHAKKILNERGHTFEMALPTVVRANNLQLNHTGTAGTIILPFKTEAGPFYLEISTEKI